VQKTNQQLFDLHQMSSQNLSSYLLLNAIIMNNRVPGFDLARSYAIFGMFIVNFNTVFGSHKDESLLGKFLSLFNGNSSTIFVILAGMGVALMTNRETYSVAEKKNLRSVVLKRSWFLFFFGLLLFLWWPADILHFYGAYMHIAALVLFINKKYYLWIAGAAILIFHVLLLIINFENGWNFDTLTYTDFWMLKGFLRNTFYNGWNPVFPWVAYFMLGMWLGRLQWNKVIVKRNVFVTGLIIFIVTEALQIMAAKKLFVEHIAFYITADYLPPFLPFMLSTAGFGLMMIVLCLVIGEKFADARWLQWLTATGRMTLTHYVLHLTVGILILVLFTGRSFEGTISEEAAVSPFFILLYSFVFFVMSIAFSTWWSKKFKQGPFEMLMRKIAG
jgi:uncharacterized protein